MVNNYTIGVYIPELGKYIIIPPSNREEEMPFIPLEIIEQKKEEKQRDEMPRLPLADNALKTKLYN